VCQILFCDEVFGYGPAAIVAAQDQLSLHLPQPLIAGYPIWTIQILLAIVPDQLQKSFVRSVDVFELDIEDRIDPVRARQ
jgi:hypothetical protein